jgi:hypothetical protein
MGCDGGMDVEDVEDGWDEWGGMDWDGLDGMGRDGR